MLVAALIAVVLFVASALAGPTPAYKEDFIGGRTSSLKQATRRGIVERARRGPAPRALTSAKVMTCTASNPAGETYFAYFPLANFRSDTYEIQTTTDYEDCAQKCQNLGIDGCTVSQQYAGICYTSAVYTEITTVGGYQTMVKGRTCEEVKAAYPAVATLQCEMLYCV